MSPLQGAAIRVRGAREGGLQGVDVDLPLERLICLCGASGSGNRTLAVDVLCAESRRRYMLALSPFERGRLGGFGRVDVETIEGLPPAVHLQGLEGVGGRLAAYWQIEEGLGRLLVRRGDIRCPHCGGSCQSYTPDEAARQIAARFAGRRCLVLAPQHLEDPERSGAVLEEMQRAGFLRLRKDGRLMQVDEVDAVALGGDFEVVVDRLVPSADEVQRLVEAVRTARAMAAGRTKVADADAGEEALFNQQLSCAACGRVHAELAADDFVGEERSALARHVELEGRALEQLEGLPLGTLRDLLGALEEGEGLAEGLCLKLEQALSLGLGHLSLGRRLQTLSTGERWRAQLAFCLGTGLVGMLYIAEGLGAAVEGGGEEEVLEALERLVDKGNTVILVDNQPALLGAAGEIFCFDRGKVERRRPEGEGGALARAPVELRGPLRVRGGEFPLSPFDLELPLGGLVVLCGGPGTGKTALLRQIASALRKSRGPGALRRVLEVDGRVRGEGGRILLAALGLAEQISRTYAATPAAQQRGYPEEWFRLGGPGGRCPACEGRGYLRYDLEFMEDLSLECPDCEGRCFRAEMLEVTHRGLSLADVLHLRVEEAAAHFAREERLRPRLEAALACGLGSVPLGREVDRLERGEVLRLEVAAHLPRLSPRDLLALDMPMAGAHPADAERLLACLEAVVGRGATALVADPHPRLRELADWVVEMGPGPGGGKIVFKGPPKAPRRGEEAGKSLA